MKTDGHYFTLKYNYIKYNNLYFIFYNNKNIDYRQNTYSKDYLDNTMAENQYANVAPLSSTDA